MGKKEQTSAWGFNRDHFCLHMTGLTFVAMHHSKVQRHGWEKTFKTHPHANTHFSTTTRKRGRGKQKVILFTTVSFLYLDHNYTHTSHLSTAHFSTYTTWLDHNPLLPKANSGTNNSDFWSDMQINWNNVWRTHSYTLQTTSTWLSDWSHFGQQLSRDFWNLLVVFFTPTLSSTAPVYSHQSPKNTSNFSSMALSGLYSGNALKATVWILPVSETHLKKKNQGR